MKKLLFALLFIPSICYGIIPKVSKINISEISNGNPITFNNDIQLKDGSVISSTSSFVSSGTIMSLSQDVAPQSGTVGSIYGLDYDEMKTYTLPANTYSKVRVRANGFVFGPFSNIVLEGYVEILVGTNSPYIYTSYPISFRVPATGTGDYFYLPYSIEYSFTQTSSTLITLRIWNILTNTQFNWYVSNFVVEGIK
jgi:hypothetical protein